MAAIRECAVRRSAFVLVLALSLCVGLLASCEPAVRDRPYGDLRLGKVSDLLEPETYLENLRLLLRRDERGWYVMSTMCTKDLSALTRKPEGDSYRFYSSYTTSSYDRDGKVLTGPAVANLPYYELFIDEGNYGGPRDTLYARIGSIKSPDWRLAVPQ